MAHQSGLSFILNFSAIFFWIIIADDTGIQTRIVRVEGEHADNKTPHPVFTCSNERVNIFSQLFNTEVLLKCRIRTKRASDYYFGETLANSSWLNNIHRRLCPQWLCDFFLGGGTIWPKENWSQADTVEHDRARSKYLRLVTVLSSLGSEHTTNLYQKGKSKWTTDLLLFDWFLTAQTRLNLASFCSDSIVA